MYFPHVFMIIGINNSYFSLKYLVFAVEMQHVFCDIGTKFLFSIKVHLIIQRNGSISTVQKKCKFPRHIVKQFVDTQIVVVYVHLKLDKIHDTVVFFNCDFFSCDANCFYSALSCIWNFFYTVCNLKLPQETIFLVLKLYDFL